MMSKPACVPRIRSSSTMTAAISASKATPWSKVRELASSAALEESSTQPHKSAIVLKIRLTSGTMFRVSSAPIPSSTIS